jgi:indolepyruvate ferredoxin oxidoreductase beta subunit
MEPIRLIIVAVGGQGNLLASRVLGEAALAGGIPVRMSEIHGMAQRGGVVESAVLFGDVQSTIISDGEADVLVGFEPSETLRAAKKCNERSVVITNLGQLPPFTVAIGKGVYPKVDEALKTLEDRVGRVISLDGTKLALDAGSAMCLNMVMLGALAKTGIIPISAESIRNTIEEKTKAAFRDMNMRAFNSGYEAVEPA